jgi:hypothetical protein
MHLSMLSSDTASPASAAASSGSVPGDVGGQPVGRLQASIQGIRPQVAALQQQDGPQRPRQAAVRARPGDHAPKPPRPLDALPDRHA